MVQLEQCLELAWKGILLDAPSLISICNILSEILAGEENVVAVSTPVTICGDIHGQFPDLKELFALNGSPPQTKYIFLGDYVDRGSMSVETMTLLFCLKVKYPFRMTLVRGNHESRQTTQIYGFHAECQKKFEGDMRIWRAFTDVFDFLPIGALVNQQHLSLHGGLSPRIHSLDQIRVLDRFMEIPADGPFAGTLGVVHALRCIDIVWSDPDAKCSGFQLSPRGAGYIFGGDIVEKFIYLNALTHISRAHQLCMEGFQVLFRDTFSTVWSAPNYCFRFGNSASVMTLDDDLRREYNVFKAAKSPADSSVTATVPSKSDVVDAGYFT